MEKFKVLKKIYGFIDSIPNLIKTIIICLCIVLVGVTYVKDNLEDIITNLIENLSSISESYTLANADDINYLLESICMRDTAAQDVILLTYHNTKKTLQGFSYLYLDYLTECKRDTHTPYSGKFLKELEYIYYSDELLYIHFKGGIWFTSEELLMRDVPKLYCNVLKYLNSTKIALYPIEGSKHPLGILIIIYDKDKVFNGKNYMLNIALPLQHLSNVLDYNKEN